MNNNESLLMTIIDIVFSLLLLIILVFFGIAVYEYQPAVKERIRIEGQQLRDKMIEDLQAQLVSKPGFEDCIVTFFDGSKLVRCPNSQTSISIREAKVDKENIVNSK